MRVIYACKTCGGEDVSRDAWADWDVWTQQWVFRRAFDHAHCHDCDGETKLVEREIIAR